MCSNRLINFLTSLSKKIHTGFLKPKYAPKKHNGAETKNQSAMRENMVPTGTAPEDLAAIKKKLSEIKMMKTTLAVN